jgi:antitoxin (DNA-binding transcriptional repressor) of toxin-antitoxin stability system
MRDTMEHRISATELTRRLGDVLARVRYRGDTFLVERNGDAVARVTPVPGSTPTTLREALEAWSSAGESEAAFADDLERVGAADRPPPNPWASY